MTGDPTITEVHVQEVQGWRKLASYVSKYIAKLELSIEGFLPDEALDYITYLHAYSETEGRVWGLFNAAFLPWGVLEFYEWADIGWLPRLKRLSVVLAGCESGKGQESRLAAAAWS